MKTIRRQLIFAIALASLSGGSALAREIVAQPQAEVQVGETPFWDVTLGAGVLVKPEYDGAADTEALGLPYLDIRYGDRFFLNVANGLGATVVNSGKLSIDAGIGFAFGRDENDDASLQGLGDIDFAPTLRAQAQWRFAFARAFLGVEKHLGGTDGVQVDAGLRTALPLAVLTGADKARGGGSGPGTLLGASVATTWSDNRYVSGYYGIDTGQAARSSFSTYAAGSGLTSSEFGVFVIHPLTEKWSLNLLAQYTRLLGDAADSPIVEKRDQTLFGVFAGYQF